MSNPNPESASTPDRRAQFKQAYRNLQLSPLLKPEERERFKVEYNEGLLDDLEQKIDFADRDSKTIFTGHQGCGKSTLLAELSARLSDEYFSVFFSIADFMEKSDIDHVKILFAIAVQLLATAEREQIRFDASERETLYYWLATKTKIETDSISMQGGIGIDFFKTIQAKLQADRNMRLEIKQEFERNISELIAQIDRIAMLIEKTTQKEVIVIIDDLDKLDTARAREIFADHVKALLQPGFRVVYTIPIALLRELDLRRGLELETNDSIEFMQVSKLYDRETTLARRGEERTAKERLAIDPLPVTVKTLSDVLLKRLEDPDLIDIQAQKLIIFYSGGVLRELIRIASACCFEANKEVRLRPGEAVRITAEMVDRVVVELRNDMTTPLDYGHTQILVQIYHELTPKHENDEGQQRFLDLLHGLYVLEYRNGDLWYDVHPMMVDLLHRRGLLLV